MRYILRNKDDREAVKKDIDSLPLDMVFDIDILEHTEKRREIQSRLYWFWLRVISEDTGNDIDTLHKTMRHTFLGYQSIMINGQDVDVLVSTTSLSVRDFSTYLKNIEAWAASELGIILPQK